MRDIVYVRKYLDQKGEEKKEYITVGYIFEKEGKISVLMKPWVNLGAFQNDKGECWLAVFEHKKLANGSKTLYKGAETVKAVQSAVNPQKTIVDEMPF